MIVLHEATRTGGTGGEIAALIAERAFEYLDAPIVRVAAARHAGPLLAAARGVLPARTPSKVGKAIRALHDY